MAVGDVLSTFGAPNAEPLGLTFDGTYLWLSDRNTDKIYKINTSGVVQSSFNSPNQTPHGLAWDNPNLWNADSTSSNIIYELNTSGTVQSTFGHPGLNPLGLTFDGTNLWISDPNNEIIYEVNTSGTVQSTFTAPSLDSRGLTWDDEHLWLADDDGLVYELTTSGNVQSTFSIPSTGPMGMAWDGTDFWHCDWDTDLVYQLEGPTAAPIEAETDFQLASTLEKQRQVIYEVNTDFTGDLTLGMKRFIPAAMQMNLDGQLTSDIEAFFERSTDFTITANILAEYKKFLEGKMLLNGDISLTNGGISTYNVDLEFTLLVSYLLQIGGEEFAELVFNSSISLESLAGQLAEMGFTLDATLSKDATAVAEDEIAFVLNAILEEDGGMITDQNMVYNLLIDKFYLRDVQKLETMDRPEYEVNVLAEERFQPVAGEDRIIPVNEEERFITVEQIGTDIPIPEKPWVELTLPTVTTTSLIGLTNTSLQASGRITDKGGENATERGFVYDTSSYGDPGNTAPGSSNYSEVKSESGVFGANKFSLNLTGLIPGTTYYVRAYAENTSGYSYGSEMAIHFGAMAYILDISLAAAGETAGEYEAAILDDWNDGVFETSRDNFLTTALEPTPPGSCPAGNTVATRPVWTKTGGSGGEGGIDVTNDNLRLKNAADNPQVEVSNSWNATNVLRTWEFKVKADSGVNKPCQFHFLWDEATGHRYYLRIDENGTVYLRRVDVSSVLIGSDSWSNTRGAYVTFKIELHYNTGETDGTFIIYEDDVELFRVIDTNYTDGDKIAFNTFSAMANNVYWWIDWLKIY